MQLENIKVNIHILTTCSWDCYLLLQWRNEGKNVLRRLTNQKEELWLKNSNKVMEKMKCMLKYILYIKEKKHLACNITYNYYQIYLCIYTESNWKHSTFMHSASDMQLQLNDVINQKKGEDWDCFLDTRRRGNWNCSWWSWWCWWWSPEKGQTIVVTL